EVLGAAVYIAHPDMRLVPAGDHLLIVGADGRSKAWRGDDLAACVVAHRGAGLDIELIGTGRGVPALIDGMVVNHTIGEIQMPGQEVRTLQLHAPGHDLRDVAENGLIV